MKTLLQMLVEIENEATKSLKIVKKNGGKVKFSDVLQKVKAEIENSGFTSNGILPSDETRGNRSNLLTEIEKKLDVDLGVEKDQNRLLEDKSVKVSNDDQEISEREVEHGSKDSLRVELKKIEEKLKLRIEGKRDVEFESEDQEEKSKKARVENGNLHTTKNGNAKNQRVQKVFVYSHEKNRADTPNVISSMMKEKEGLGIPMSRTRSKVKPEEKNRKIEGEHTTENSERIEPQEEKRKLRSIPQMRTERKGSVEARVKHENEERARINVPVEKGKIVPKAKVDLMKAPERKHVTEERGKSKPHVKDKPVSKETDKIERLKAEVESAKTNGIGFAQSRAIPENPRQNIFESKRTGKTKTKGKISKHEPAFQNLSFSKETPKTVSFRISPTLKKDEKVEYGEASSEAQIWKGKREILNPVVEKNSENRKRERATIENEVLRFAENPRIELRESEESHKIIKIGETRHVEKSEVKGSVQSTNRESERNIAHDASENEKTIVEVERFEIPEKEGFQNLLFNPLDEAAPRVELSRIVEKLELKVRSLSTSIRKVRTVRAERNEIRKHSRMPKLKISRMIIKMESEKSVRRSEISERPIRDALELSRDSVTRTSNDLNKRKGARVYRELSKSETKVEEKRENVKDDSVLKQSIDVRKSEVQNSRIDAQKLESNIEKARRAVESLVTKIGRKGGVREKAVVELEPPRLGKLEIEVVKEGGKIRVEFKVASPEAKDMLEKKMDNLLSKLNNGGFSVERIEVKFEKQEHLRDEDGDYKEQDQNGQNESRDEGQGRKRKRDPFQRILNWEEGGDEK